MAGALDISHQQASAIGAAPNTFGAFNFSPSKGLDMQKLLIIGGVAMVVLLVLKKRKK